MSWSSRVATLVVGAMLLTPMHIFLRGNSSAKDVSQHSVSPEGKTTWQLMKEIQSRVEEAERHGSSRRAPLESDFNYKSDSSSSNDANNNQKSAKKSSQTVSPPSSSGIFKLMLPFWAVNEEYNDDMKKLSTGGQDFQDGFDEADAASEKSSDPLENGTMLAISGILLFVMIAVLAFDIGEKTPWPAIVLSRANLFGSSNVGEGSRKQQGSNKSRSRAGTPAGVNSHRVEQYLKSKRLGKEESPSRSAGSKRISLGFNKTAGRSRAASKYTEYVSEDDSSAATTVESVLKPDDRRAASHRPSFSRSPQRSVRSERFSCRSAAAAADSNTVKTKKSGVWDSSTSPSPSPSRSTPNKSRSTRSPGKKQHADELTTSIARKSTPSPAKTPNLQPGTSGVYQVVKSSPARSVRSSNNPRNDSRSIHTYSNPLPPQHRQQQTSQPSAAPAASQSHSVAGDNILRGSSCSFAVEANPQGYLLKGGRINSKNKQNTSRQESEDHLIPRPPPFLNYVLQALCQCPILKYFFVDGLSQVYFDDGERLASPLTQLFANFIRNVWHPPPNTKINTDTLQNIWAENAINMFKVDSPALEHYLSSLFLALYTDIRRVAKTRSQQQFPGQHLSSDQVTRIGRLIGSSILERRKLEVNVTDEDGVQVPHELLAHSALTFPGVTFSSSAANSTSNNMTGNHDDSYVDDVRDAANRDFQSLLSSVCRSASGTRLKIENESMQIPCLLNFHYPGHYFTNFPEKLYIRKDVAAAVDHAGDDDGDQQQLQHSQQHHRYVSSNGDLFSLYAVVFQLRDQQVFSVAIKHAQRGGWFYTEGTSVAKCKACPSQVPPKSASGSCPKPILLLYAAEKWNDDLPFFNASEAFAEQQAINIRANRSSSTIHRCFDNTMTSPGSKKSSRAASSRASPQKNVQVHYESMKDGLATGGQHYPVSYHRCQQPTTTA